MKFYLDQYESDPDSFPFLKPIHLNTVITNFEYINLFAYSETGKDEVNIIFDVFENIDEYYKMKDAPEHIQLQRLISITGIQSNYIDYESFKFWDFRQPRILFSDRQIHEKIKEWSDRHFTQFELKLALMEVLPSTSQNFDVIDIQPLIHSVNDEQFQYELEESVKAFNAGLYFAACTTAGVALETALKILCKRNLKPHEMPLEKDRTIHNLTKALREKGIIDERMEARIKRAKDIRNAASHSNTGEMLKMDAEQLFLTIQVFVQSSFKN